MIVVVFRSRSRPSLAPHVLERLAALGQRMDQLARAQPGFLSYTDFTAADGESVTVAEFETAAHVVAWREQPEHKEAQQWGREEVFADYTIQVCEVLRTTRFPAAR